MYPHGDGRRRRVGQPPLAPQHLMGIAQQGPPGVMVPLPNQPVQILQQNQHHYPAPASYQQGQQSNSHYVSSAPPPPPPPGPYHQQPPYPHANTQVVLTKQAVNHNKHYREDYKVLKDHNYNPERSKYNYGYQYRHHLTFKGHPHQPPVPKPKVEPKMAHPTKIVPEKEEEESQSQEEAPSPDSTTKEPVQSSVMPSSKEKTPMCMVNELARFNKISHQYRLTNEQGPAHQKNFTVTLTLGSEDYTADGPSIKKAQHAAAADALSKTSYSHPTPKHNKPSLAIGKTGNMTPTVELNALAMKRGEPAIYRLVEYPHGATYQPQQTLTFRRPYGRGGRVPVRLPYSNSHVFVVSLKVGNTEFLGEGSSPQAARHDAAAKALTQLRSLPLPEQGSSDEGSNAEPELESSIKSPVSLVHEIALKRNLSVVFNVVSEKGPPHMKTFITECKVGELRTEGEGNGKKVSKKRAAEIMLKELRKLPPLSPSLTRSVSFSRMKRKPLQSKKKTRNLIKVTQQEPKPETVTPEEINPISRLIQIQQMKKEKEPVYTLLEEKGGNRRREFFMEVAVGELTAVGSGPNKKVAKKNAAHNLLMTIDKKAGKSEKDDNTEVKQENPSGSGGRQLAPGVLLVSEKKPTTSSNAATSSTNTPASSSTTISDTNTGMTTTATTTTAAASTATETTSTISSTTTASSEVKTSLPTTDSVEETQNLPVLKTSKKGVGPKDHLLYLSKLLNFEVVFSDYPKANHKEHLSLVSLSTDPPQVCHGSAATIEESQNIAAATALRALTEMGLDSVTSTTTTASTAENN